MTENTKIAMTAINKWFYYAMNFNVVPIEVETFDGVKTEYLPDCFNAFPKSMRGHFANKWNYGYKEYGSRGVLMWFYGELSTNYRKDLMEWVLNNYNDEQKLNFNEED